MSDRLRPVVCYRKTIGALDARTLLQSLGWEVHLAPLINGHVQLFTDCPETTLVELGVLQGDGQ